MLIYCFSFVSWWWINISHVESNKSSSALKKKKKKWSHLGIKNIIKKLEVAACSM